MFFKNLLGLLLILLSYFSNGQEIDNLNDLLKNLSSNTTIELRPGMYNVSDLDTNATGTHFKWSYYFEGQDEDWRKSMLVIRDMENIVLKGLGYSPERVQIYSEDSDAIVLIFENCKNVTLDNVWLGHITQSQSCESGVISFVDCDYITLKNIEMYGTGFLGFETYNAKKMMCSNAEISDCTGGAFRIVNCDSSILENSFIHDNSTRENFSSFVDCPFVEIRSCFWSDNLIDNSSPVDNQALFHLWNANLFIWNSEFANNHVESFINRKANDSYSSSYIEMIDNIIEQEMEWIYEE